MLRQFQLFRARKQMKNMSGSAGLPLKLTEVKPASNRQRTLRNDMAAARGGQAARLDNLTAVYNRQAGWRSSSSTCPGPSPRLED